MLVNKKKLQNLQYFIYKKLIIFVEHGKASFYITLCWCSRIFIVIYEFACLPTSIFHTFVNSFSSGDVKVKKSSSV